MLLCSLAANGEVILHFGLVSANCPNHNRLGGEVPIIPLQVMRFWLVAKSSKQLGFA
jgi:hypothetical protein